MFFFYFSCWFQSCFKTVKVSSIVTEFLWLFLEVDKRKVCYFASEVCSRGKDSRKTDSVLIFFFSFHRLDRRSIERWITKKMILLHWVSPRFGYRVFFSVTGFPYRKQRAQSQNTEIARWMGRSVTDAMKKKINQATGREKKNRVALPASLHFDAGSSAPGPAQSSTRTNRIDQEMPEGTWNATQPKTKSETKGKNEKKNKESARVFSTELGSKFPWLFCGLKPFFFNGVLLDLIQLLWNGPPPKKRLFSAQNMGK